MTAVLGRSWAMVMAVLSASMPLMVTVQVVMVVAMAAQSARMVEWEMTCSRADGGASPCDINIGREGVVNPMLKTS